MRSALLLSSSRTLATLVAKITAMDVYRGAIIAAFIFLLPIPAFACSCEERSQAEMFQAADSVFYARINDVKLPSKWSELGELGKEARRHPAPLDDYVVARYELIEVFKGEPNPEGVVVSLFFGPGNCGLPLFPGLYFVLFLDEHDATFLCSGTFHLGWRPDQEAAQQKLAALRQLRIAPPRRHGAGKESTTRQSETGDRR